MTNNFKRVRRLPEETYECSGCKRTEFRSEQFVSAWRCPDCGGEIYIFAEDKERDAKGTYIRKRADELEVGDLVTPGGVAISNSYTVKGVINKGSGKLGVGLEGFGQVVHNPDDCVNVRIGGYWR